MKAVNIPAVNLVPLMNFVWILVGFCSGSGYETKMEQQFSAVHPFMSGPSTMLGDRITALSAPSVVQPLPTIVPPELSVSLQLGPVDGQAPGAEFELQNVGAQMPNTGSGCVNTMRAPSTSSALDREEATISLLHGQVHIAGPAKPSRVPIPDATPSTTSVPTQDTSSDIPQSTQKREREEQLADGDTIQEDHSPVRKKKNHLASDVLCEPTH